MAHSDKKIGIFPNTNNQNANPEIVFTGFDNKPITLEVLENNFLAFKNFQDITILTITNSGILVDSIDGGSP
jgi:hypothetical protein